MTEEDEMGYPRKRKTKRGPKKRPRHDCRKWARFTPKEGTPTEREFQILLHQRCAEKQHVMVVPNTRVFGWESDLITTTKSGYVHEFEIKRSRGDYERDFSKSRHRDLIAYQNWRKPESRPNYFWYVAPEGVVDPDGLPAHAGLIVYRRPPSSKSGAVRLAEIKKAPRLHVVRQSERTRQYLERGMRARLWSALMSQM